MLCPHCGKEIRDDSKICEQCGKGIPRCPSCGRAMVKRTRFCTYDGTRLPEDVLALFPETEPPVQPKPPAEPAQQSQQGKPAPFVLPVTPEKPAQAPAPQQKPAQYEVPASQQRPGQYGVPASQQSSTAAQGAAAPARRFCINCGKPCAANQKYCADCMMGAEPAAPVKKKKSKLPILIAVLMILLLILCAVVGVLFWKATSDTEDSGKSSTSSSKNEKDEDDDEDSDDEDSDDKDSDDEDSDDDSDEKTVERVETTAPVETTTAPAETTAAPTETTTAPKEPVYTYSYELVVSDMSWEQARRACEAKGGYLATVDSAEEFAIISEMAEESGLTYVWLGACLATGDSEWEDTTWVTGEPMTYTNWFPGEPSKYDVDGTEEFYLCIWDVSVDGKDVGWTFNDQRNDLVGTMPSISGKLGYICEYKTEVIE